MLPSGITVLFTAKSKTALRGYFQCYGNGVGNSDNGKFHYSFLNNLLFEMLHSEFVLITGNVFVPLVN
jgi:hypothetical protein